MFQVVLTHRGRFRSPPRVSAVFPYVSPLCLFLKARGGLAGALPGSSALFWVGRLADVTS